MKAVLKWVRGSLYGVGIVGASPIVGITAEGGVLVVALVASSFYGLFRLYRRFHPVVDA